METNELKCTDLRIGNWIKYEDKLVQVVQVSSLMILCQRDENQFLVNCAPEVFQPIELTEELMLKIGFVRIELVKNEQHKYYRKICIGNYSYILEFIVVPKDEYICFYIIEFGKEGEDDEVDYYSEVFSSDNIKYLHKLQNAYYLLTNEELEVEL